MIKKLIVNRGIATKHFQVEENYISHGTIFTGVGDELDEDMTLIVIIKSDRAVSNPLPLPLDFSPEFSVKPFNIRPKAVVEISLWQKDCKIRDISFDSRDYDMVVFSDIIKGSISHNMEVIDLTLQDEYLILRTTEIGSANKVLGILILKLIAI